MAYWELLSYDLKEVMFEIVSYHRAFVLSDMKRITEIEIMALGWDFLRLSAYGL